MKTLKFRAWDAKRKEIFIPEAIVNAKDYGSEEYYKEGGFYYADVWYGTEIRDIKPDIILMQYVGIKDRNGKEIYEGDIIKHFAGELGVVKFKDGCFGVEWLNGDFRISVPFEHHTIIGNIYENPELLKVKNKNLKEK